MNRFLRATAFASLVAGPLGVLVQRRLSFELLSIDEGGRSWWRIPAYFVAALLMGLLTALVAGAPVEYVLGRLHVRRARWWSVPLASGIAVWLFSLVVPWGLRAGEVVLLLGWMAVFFGVRAIFMEGRAHRSTARRGTAIVTSSRG